MEEDGELYNFIKVWLMILASLSYCYSVGKIIPKGKTRLFLFLPIICLFLILPLNLSSMHFAGMTSFFISWLANFKLWLYAFDRGPLFTNPPISLIQFLLLACFPIKIKDNPSRKSHLNDKNKENPVQNGQSYKNPIPKKFHKSIISYALKFILLAILIRVYDYSEFIHPKASLVLLCFHTYFFLDLALALLAFLARAVLGFELEPHFNKPHLSTSLQNFWGKRWNIMVSSILRLTVYNPLVKTYSPLVGRRWSPLPAIMSTFAVSAIMHELIFYYLGRVKPTWEITLFFLLHGFCVAVEVGLKKVVDGRWCLSVWITRPSTFVFLLVTLFWLFFPPFLRCRVYVRGFEEYAAVSVFMKEWWSWFFIQEKV